jgi:hypothetical protein
LMRKQVEDAPLPPQMFSKQIPLSIEQAIMRSLAKKPDARFQTADEFRAVLLKNIEDVTGRLANVSAPEQQLNLSPLPVERQKSIAASQPVAGTKSKKVPDTLDFSSEPPQPVKETRLPDVPQAILKETRLAQDAQSDLQAQETLKEIRVANHQQIQIVSGVNPQLKLNPQLAINQQQTSPQNSPVTTFINRLNWKHYSAAILLALLSIPIAFLAAPDTPSQANINQSLSRKNPVIASEPKSEANAQTPSPRTRPEPVEPATRVEAPMPVPSDDTASQEKSSETTRTGKKARRVNTPQRTPSREPAKPSESNDKDKKDEKKKEKKGGLFDKVKGGFKKINPF